MGRQKKHRRSIFRRDAGRAFLRFLIGLILLVVLCCVFYLFVLQGEVNWQIPEPKMLQTTVQPTAEPTADPGIIPDSTPDTAASPTPAA